MFINVLKRINILWRLHRHYSFCNSTTRFGNICERDVRYTSTRE